MTIIQAIVLGIIQGITEFLPISSSGHLVLLQKFWDIKENILTFDIALHFATLLVIIVVMRKNILELLRKPICKTTGLLLIATIPVGLIGFLFNDFIEDLFKTGNFLGYAFIFTGIIIYLSEKIKRKEKIIKEMNIFDSIIIGIAQALAVIPGVSRSGMTISAGLFRGIKKEQAIQFSFLLTIPAILGASLKDIIDITVKSSIEVSLDFTLILFGMFAAFISGYFAIKFMLGFFTRVKLKGFSYYLITLGMIVLIDKLFLHIL